MNSSVATNLNDTGIGIAVLGALDPGRNLTILLSLRDYFDRRGWSERIAFSTGGLGKGAGRASGEWLESLQRHGWQVEARDFPDVELHPKILDDADYFVVATSEEADALLEWPEATGKEILALTDFGDEAEHVTWALEDPAANIDDFSEQVVETVPLLARAVIANRPD